MLLNIIHRTTYRYAQPARDSFNEVRLQPIDLEWQKRLSFSLTSNPPAPQHDYLDLYQNRVYLLELAAPHTELAIEMKSRVETTCRPQPVPEAPSGLHQPALAFQLHDFLMDTEFVQLSPELWRCAVDCLPNGLSDVWSNALTLSNWVYESFQYAPGTTHAHTTVNETLTDRRGVCQDFAHVLLGLCRSLKIPARYVSGYFFNDQFDPALGGSEASHAWVEVFLPQQGWYGLDPTHRRPVDDRYVSVAVGRDYQDIRPVSGAYRGASEREMDVHVRIAQEMLYEATV
ncbi:transglutaminase family protein [Cerasicoccus arenae]|uniref:Transglutaminase n=1 Tax=Cerasicoccus arenae TaxID=424488 RepID=A0A8J3GG15_9BACT|nr:transglutaminase family protein [Cerasicoccus arenae]MBK1858392.1 transglutaminase family protein [Cerasicoccus arenae]GHC09982.1 transglutaminase [Cerasicoccus arenae]